MTTGDLVKMIWDWRSGEWPDWVVDPPQPPPITRVKNGELRVTFINHSTVMIQMDSINILTDPIWSERVGNFSWIGPKRVRLPGIRMDDLPPIDFILVSHNHYDHLDIASIELLVEKYNPKILVGLGIKELLISKGITNVIEMDWWDQFRLNTSPVAFCFVPARHNSGRGLFDKNKTLWGGFVISSRAGNIYFAGDTGYGVFLQKIKERFGIFRLTILPIGNYEKRQYMKKMHMNPDDAVRAHQLINSSQSVGIHLKTFPHHGQEAIDEPEKQLSIALKKHSVSDSTFWVLKFGEGRYVSS